MRAVERMLHPSVRAATMATRFAGGRTLGITDIMLERAGNVKYLPVRNGLSRFARQGYAVKYPRRRQPVAVRGLDRLPVLG